MPTDMRLLVLLALLVAPVAGAQDWTAVPPPFPQTQAVEITGLNVDTLFMVADGLYRSTDAGESWMRLDIVLDEGGQAVRDHSIVTLLPGGGVAVTGRLSAAEDPQVYVSEDAGTTWRSLGVVGSVVEPFGVDSLLVGDFRTILLENCDWRCTSIGGTVVARDGSGRRDDVFSRVQWHEAAVSADGNAIYGSIEYASAPVERSRDRGLTWDTLSVANALDLLTLGGDTLIVATFDGISSSIDGGDTFQTAFAIPGGRSFDGELTTSPHGWLYARFGGGVPGSPASQYALLVSKDRGVTWESLSTETAKGRAFLPAAVPVGVWARTPDDVWFSSASTEYVCVTKSGSGSSDPSQWFAGGGHLAFVYRGTPGNWTVDPNVPVGWRGYSALSTLSGIIGESAATHDGLFFGGGAPCDELWYSYGGQVNRQPVLVANASRNEQQVVLSDSAGVRRLSPAPTFVGGEADLSTWKDLTYEGRYLAVSERAVWTSTDGAEWTHRAALPPSNTSSPVGIAGTSTGVVVVYRDGATMRLDGDVWTSVSGTQSVAEFQGIERSRADYRAWGKGGVVVSMDDAANWSPLGSGLDDETVYSFLSLGDGRYLAGTESGVWELSDSNSAWMRLDTGIDTDTYGPVLALQLSPYQPCFYENFCGVAYQVLAFTEQQAYMGFDLGSDFTDASRATETTLTLSNPSPTPSMGGVRLDVTTPTRATLEAYDLLGRRVWQTDVQLGAGSIEWNGTGTNGGRVGAGVYLIVLRTDSETRTTRAVLL